MTRRAFFAFALMPFVRPDRAVVAPAAMAFTGGKVEVFAADHRYRAIDILSSYPTPAHSPSRAWPEAMYRRKP